MANKHDYLILALIIIGCLGILWLIIEPIIFWTNYSELRICVRLFLLLFSINTFAVLRLYNSIVQNTKFSIKLREALIKFQQIIPGVERSLKNLNSTMGNVRSSSDNLKKNLAETSDKLSDLTSKISKMK